MLRLRVGAGCVSRRLRQRCVMARAVRPYTATQSLRKHIQQMRPYTPVQPFEVVAERIGKPLEQIVKLDANENLYGPPPEVLTALASMPHSSIYPDPEVTKLRKALSDYVQVPVEHLMVGCGADELIDLILRCVLDDGDCIVDCPPTFTMYAFDVAVNNGRTVRVPRNPDFSLDVPAIEEAVMAEQPKALFLTSPNNPDGSLIHEADLLKLLELPVLVVLDEAYQEFTDSPSHISWVPKHPNLIVLRTFSKCAALAGLRVGYGAFPLDFVSYLCRAKQPYNVSVAAEVAGCAALSNLDYMKRTRDLIVQERHRLYRELVEIPFLQTYPSESNFILCKMLGVDAKSVKDALYKDGILIRHYDNEYLKDYVRISVGRPQDTDALISALKQLQV